MLELHALYKSFQNVMAVEDVKFSVKPGEVLGLVGPNGAGKTTTIRLIMNILRPDSGEITLDGEDRTKVPRRRFGYIPEERGLYQRARVLDLLTYIGKLNGLSKHRAGIEAIRLLDKLGMVDYTQSRINELSKGMQQKIQFITAVQHDPDVLILDEPFTGLDPINQIVLRELIAQFKQEEKIIILSTHQMNEVEKLCDHICLLNQGKIILDGNLDDIRDRFREKAFYIEADKDLAFLHKLKNVEVLEEHNKSCKISFKNQTVDTAKLFNFIYEKAGIKKFIQVEPSLDEIFINLVQKDKSKNK